MGIMAKIKTAWRRLFGAEVKKVFGVIPQLSETMDDWISTWNGITAGTPYWEDPEDDVHSIGFAGYIDDVTAGLATLDLGIEVSGSARAEYLQKQADYVLARMQDKVSEGLGNVGIIFKPNGVNTDYVSPGDFIPTDTNSNGDILGCVFRSTYTDGTWYYTRLEWHRFEDALTETGENARLYRITNLCYKANSSTALGDPCPLTEVPDWAGLLPDIYIENVEKPLFAYFKNPMPNRYDRGSALGAPIWGTALTELRDLDIAWSRKSAEVEDSKHMTFIPQDASKYADQHRITLPRFLLPLEMGTIDQEVKEHVATLLTDQRIKDINSILSMISTKCGFSQGFFQLDEKSGMMTATQVEADDQETIRTIKNIRQALQLAIDDLLYAHDKMADLYSIVPPGPWEVAYNFGDITYNFEEDRQHHYALALQGKYPWTEYYVKYLGYSMEDAIRLLDEAQSAIQPATAWGDEE